MANHKTIGNILGNARAEADQKMLSKAFIETSDFRALTDTRDFNFVVGRRGTGKSALFLQLSREFADKKQYILVTAAHREYEAFELISLLKECGSDYSALRVFTRQLWRVAIIFSVLKRVLQDYKIQKSATYSFLKRYSIEHQDVYDRDDLGLILAIARKAFRLKPKMEELPGVIVKMFDVDRLFDKVSDALDDIKKVAVVLYDGLDEGWAPDIYATSNLGGLSIASSDFSERQKPIHILLFVRDNMFRALGYFDSDFSRHIEGSSLRLQWDENSLFQFVTLRLRRALNLDSVESDLKVWNRFAHRDLKGKEGFRQCLLHTLYRPRDILVLLNKAFRVASRSGRQDIIESDIETTSLTISHDRYSDLIKEYEQVLPGVSLFTGIFRGGLSLDSYQNIVAKLDKALEEQNYEADGSGDFAIFNSGRQIYDALYSIGFFGYKEEEGAGHIFCHDGSPGTDREPGPDNEIIIHPCYWKYLGLTTEIPEHQMMVRINDEYQAHGRAEAVDYRTKQIGQIVDELPQLPMGKEGANEFEKWVSRAIAVLFAGKLINIELHPNKDAIQRRDVVATNMTMEGFWHRILQDYDSRQVIFEVKNYAELKIDDFRQVLSYATGEYGRFAVIVTRSENEGLSETEKGYVRTMYLEHNRLIMTCPASLLARCLGKYRKKERYDYVEDQFNKRMDTFVRRYLSLPHTKPYRRRRKKGK